MAPLTLEGREWPRPAGSGEPGTTTPLPVPVDQEQPRPAGSDEPGSATALPALENQERLRPVSSGKPGTATALRLLEDRGRPGTGTEKRPRLRRAEGVGQMVERCSDGMECRLLLGHLLEVLVLLMGLFLGLSVQLLGALREGDLQGGVTGLTHQEGLIVLGGRLGVHGEGVLALLG